MVFGGSRGGVYSAEWGTERNCIFRDWYWLLGAAAEGVIQQNWGESEIVS